MRGINSILIVLMLTIIAQARVDIKCTAAGKVVTVEYKVVGESNKARAFALDISSTQRKEGIL